MKHELSFILHSFVGFKLCKGPTLALMGNTKINKTLVFLEEITQDRYWDRDTIIQGRKWQLALRIFCSSAS